MVRRERHKILWQTEECTPLETERHCRLPLEVLFVSGAQLFVVDSQIILATSSQKADRRRRRNARLTFRPLPF